MCFSPEASFGVAGLLLPAGAYCVHQALTKNRAFLPMAFIPLAFGSQQACEGVVWLGLHQGNDVLVRQVGLVYLAFALPFWLFWIPFVAFSLNPPGTKRSILALNALVGLAAGLAAFLPFATDPERLDVRVAHHSVHYNFDTGPIFYRITPETGYLIYVLIVSFPMFIATRKRFMIVGAGLVLDAAISQIMFPHAFASVWCFLAAFLSLYLVLFFRKLPSAASEQKPHIAYT
jgi:hypothetical protein